MAPSKAGPVRRRPGAASAIDGLRSSTGKMGWLREWRSLSPWWCGRNRGGPAEAPRPRRPGAARRGRAEPGGRRPARPHLPWSLPASPSHVAPGAAGRPPPRPGPGVGRGAAAVSGARAAADPTRTVTPPRRVAFASGLRARLGRGLPALGASSRQLPPHHFRRVSGRSPSQAAAGVRLEFAPETPAGGFCSHGAVGAIELTRRDWGVGLTSPRTGLTAVHSPKTHLCILSRVVLFCFTCFKMFCDLSKGKINFPKTIEQERAEGNFETC